MRIATAAAYLDVSESLFRDRVEEGVYPPGKPERGIKLWLRDDLYAYIDSQFGIGKRSTLDDVDPFKAPASNGKRRASATV